jgi:hypothetical protein
LARLARPCRHTVANGGTLYEPHLVRATVRDGARTDVAPKPLREAINAETAATMTTIMEDVAAPEQKRKTTCSTTAVRNSKRPPDLRNSRNDRAIAYTMAASQSATMTRPAAAR